MALKASGPQPEDSDVLYANREALRGPPLFQSFFQGGFECSTHKLNSGVRLDIIAGTEHDRLAYQDYKQLAEHSITTVRDGFRWHLIEKSKGEYSWDTVLLMIKAAVQAKTEVIWDLMHYGWPDGIDIWKPEFVSRFAAFAGACAKTVRDHSDNIPFYSPINEISFLSWGGGEVGYLNPFSVGRSFELKVQLVRAAIAAMHAIMQEDPRARFVHCDPIINVVPDPGRPWDQGEAEGYRNAQFQAWDMISGASWPQLGGNPRLLDIVGVNYYPRNQWILNGPALEASDSQYKPLSVMLDETFVRYGRPMFIAETGVEDEDRPHWFRYVCNEAAIAMAGGTKLEGICLYPIVDHFGWDNDRLCANGLLSVGSEHGRRRAYEPLATELQCQQTRWLQASTDKVLEL